MNLSESWKTKRILYAILPIAATLLLLNAPFSTTATAQAASVEPHTKEAVIAADDGWDKAEQTGNVDFLDALLLPNYRSISSDGSTYDKAAIIASARKNVSSGKRAAAEEQWRATHPYLVSVEIAGDTAILTFALNTPDSSKPMPIMSCDIFVYQDSHWRAIYSQHSEAGK
jgi:hypothetical protein